MFCQLEFVLLVYESIKCSLELPARYSILRTLNNWVGSGHRVKDLWVGSNDRIKSLDRLVPSLMHVFTKLGGISPVILFDLI